MRKLVYFISLSLDGFIAGPEDEVDFFDGSDEYMQRMVNDYADLMPDHARVQLGLSEQPLSRFDTVVMGRRTYEPALTMGISSPYSHLRQLVFSRTLVSADPAVQVVASDPLDTIRSLKSEDSTMDIYLAGGGQLAAVLRPEIDELIIKRYPVIVGSGLRAFAHGYAPIQFAMVDNLTFASGNSITRFTPVPQS